MTTPQKQHFQNPAEALAAMREGIGGQLESLRAEIAELRDQLESVDDGAVPKAEYTARVAAWVDDQAQQFAQGAEFAISALRLPRAQPREVTVAQIPVRGGGSDEIIAAADAGPLLCFLFADTLKERLGQLIEQSAYIQGPPSGERDRMRAEIEEELDRLESEEEALIVEGEAVGLTLHRRPDARPSIILALEPTP